MSWRPEGLRWIQGEYRNDVKHGTWTTWNDIGLVEKEERFENGRAMASDSD
jgi:antitoxin component YwqK of YwqJK toxin-antitoxin module